MLLVLLFSLLTQIQDVTKQYQKEPNRQLLAQRMDSAAQSYSDPGLKALAWMWTAQVLEETEYSRSEEDTLTSAFFYARTHTLLPDLAQLKTRRYQRYFNRKGNGAGWHNVPTLRDWFLYQTGDTSFHPAPCKKELKINRLTEERLSLYGYTPSLQTTHDSIPVCFSTTKGTSAVRIKLYRLTETEQKQKPQWVATVTKEYSDTLDFTDTLRFAPQPYGIYVAKVEARHPHHWVKEEAKKGNYQTKENRYIRVTDMRYYQENWNTGKTELAELQVVDAWTGEPIHDAEITIDTILTSLRQDVYYHIRRGDDQFHLPIRQLQARGITTTTNCSRLMLDRKTYRPGDTLHLAAYFFQQQIYSRTPYQGRVVLALKNVDNEVVARDTLEADSYGAVQSELALPTTGKNGQYSITLRALNSKNTVQKYFDVEAFKLPTFYLSLKETEQQQLRADSMRIKGRMLSYAGEGLSDQSVHIQTVGSIRIDTTLQTDAKGYFCCSYSLDSTKHYYYSLVQAEATDATGETQQEQTWVYLAERQTPLRDTKPRWDSIPANQVPYIPQEGQTLTPDSAFIMIGCLQPQWVYYSAYTDDRAWSNGYQKCDSGFTTLRIARPQQRNAELHLCIFTTTHGLSERKSITLPAAVRDELHIGLVHFRDSVYPGKTEQIQLQLTNEKGEGIEGEVTASMIHLALWKKNNNIWTWPKYSNNSLAYQASIENQWYKSRNNLQCNHSERINWQLRYPGFEFNTPTLYGDFDYFASPVRVRGMASKNARIMNEAASLSYVVEEEEEVFCCASSPKLVVMLNDIKLKTEDTKTAFWTALQPTDSQGRLTLNYSVPLDNSQFHLQMMAVGRNLSADTLTRVITLLRPLRAHIGLPRFLRQGDETTLMASIQNILSEDIAAAAVLEIFDPKTGENYSTDTTLLRLKANRTDSVQIACRVPEQGEQVGVRLRVVNANGDGDGEQQLLTIFPSAPADADSSFALRPQDLDRAYGLLTDFDSTAITPGAISQNLHALALQQTYRPSADYPKQEHDLFCRLQQLQRADGGLAWLPNTDYYKSDYYSSLIVLERLAELHQQGIQLDSTDWTGFTTRLLNYVDSMAVYQKERSLTYAYARTLWMDVYPASHKVEQRLQKTYKDIEETWNDYPTKQKAYAALTLYLAGKQKSATKIMTELRRLAIKDSTYGTHWFTWDTPYQRRPQQLQQTLINTFKTLDPQVEELASMEHWLRPEEVTVKLTRSSKGNQQKIGSKVTLTVTLRTGHSIDHVIVIAPRMANLEPCDTRSRYDFSGRWLRGMPYYIDVRDTENRYYIDHLPEGTHSLSFDCYVTHKGKFNSLPAILKLDE